MDIFHSQINLAYVQRRHLMTLNIKYVGCLLIIILIFEIFTFNRVYFYFENIEILE
jgi:hypothetical protein